MRWHTFGDASGVVRTRYTTWNEQNVVCCKSDLAGEQENWGTSCQKGGAHKARPLRTPHASVAAITCKKRGQAALGSSCFGVALGWEARVLIRDEGWEEEHRRTTKLIRGYNNRAGEPTDCCCTTNTCCCAVPPLLLKAGNTFGPGSTRAGRAAGPPYRSTYRHHRGNWCVIHSSSVEATYPVFFLLAFYSSEASI